MNTNRQRSGIKGYTLSADGKIEASILAPGRPFNLDPYAGLKTVGGGCSCTGRPHCGHHSDALAFSSRKAGKAPKAAEPEKKKGRKGPQFGGSSTPPASIMKT